MLGWNSNTTDWKGRDTKRDKKVRFVYAYFWLKDSGVEKPDLWRQEEQNAVEEHMDKDRSDDDIYPLSSQEEYSTEQGDPFVNKNVGFHQCIPHKHLRLI